MNNIDIWKSIVYNRINGIYSLIGTPGFLTDEISRRTFTSAIVNYITTQITDRYKTFEHRACFVYGTLLPLEKHFKGIEEQSFISNIINSATMNAAINRIKQQDWQCYTTEIIRTTQNTPSSAARNNDGMSVGRGLKTTGTMKYWCERCQNEVGYTETAYWSHQEKEHNNPRIKLVKRKLRTNH